MKRSIRDGIVKVGAASQERSPAFIELRAVSKQFKPGLLKKIQVINELSCAFAAGQCTALLGHNGAGKTTTIRMILGLTRPDRGELLCRGQVMQRQDRADIGYMPEVSKLPLDLTCEEVLRHQLHLFRPDQRRDSAQLIDAKLAEVGLANHRQKRVGKLSKGMGRRLAWAQATIHRPQFLILDEPFSGLDPLGRLEMQGWMTALKRQGTGMLVCTHEFWSVQELCDEVYVLNKGRVVYTSLGDQQAREQRGYAVTVEQKTELELKQFSAACGLPAWSRIQAGAGPDRLTLGFGSYGEASAWLSALVQHGVTVAHFGQEAQWGEGQFMRYFA